MICQNRWKLKKYGWWWLKSKNSYLHKTIECWKIIQCHLVRSITTYQVNYPRRKITIYLQISILSLSSVTWSQNVQLSPTNLKCMSSSWSDIAGLENCNSICWNSPFQQKKLHFNESSSKMWALFTLRKDFIITAYGVRQDGSKVFVVIFPSK